MENPIAELENTSQLSDPAIRNVTEAAVMSQCKTPDTQARWLRKCGWKNNGVLWQDPIGGGSSPTNFALTIQIKRFIEPYKGVLKEINPHHVDTR